jgi:hypothetical protein
MHPYTLEFGVDPEFLPPEPLWLAVEPLIAGTGRAMADSARHLT